MAEQGPARGRDEPTPKANPTAKATAKAKPKAKATAKAKPKADAKAKPKKEVKPKANTQKKASRAPVVQPGEQESGGFAIRVGLGQSRDQMARGACLALWKGLALSAETARPASNAQRPSVQMPTGHSAFARRGL